MLSVSSEESRRVFVQSGRGLLSLALLMVAAGCAQCAPDQVGPGVARLTVRNVGAMVSLVNADTSCGFASQAVLGNPTIEGEVGGEGSITFSVADCVIDAGEGLEVSKSCTDVTTTAKGKVTISAKRTVKGLLTGNPSSPVIPGGPDAVTITLEKATFENFLVENSASENKLTMIEGSLSAVVSPRLAVSASTGACAVATPHTSFTDITYAASKVFVDTPSNQFEAEVDSSKIVAQNGIKGDHTNDFSGTISVWGSEVPVPQKGDDEGLDPDFDAAKFEEGFACTGDLAQPVSFTCEDLKPRLAGGVARLTARTIGTITSMIDANTACGFSSTAVAGTPTFTGEVGKDNSTATFTITNGCTLTLPPDTLLSTDCAGVETRGSGTVVVTGTKTVTGFRTGNPLRPIVPTRRDPAAFALNIQFTDFKLVNSASTSFMTIKSGELSGKVAPRTGLDKTTGACSISTPVVTFSDLVWNDADVRLVNDGNNFDLSVGSSSLTAQNGTKDGASNTINGAITVDGTSYSLASEPLDTAFDQAKFDASYTCNPNLIVPPVEAMCSFRQALGTAAAQLLVKTLATSTSVVNANTSCGFSSNGVLTAPTGVTGDPGQMGSVEWTVTDCAVGPLPVDTTISTNCIGTQTKAGGTVTASGTKTVTGMRNTNPPIVPVSREAATLQMTSMVFDDLEIYDLPNGATAATTRSSVTGTAAVTVKPVGGESDTNAGVYSITTPVASIESLTMQDGTITIVRDGNRFDLVLADVEISAFNGTYNGNSNQISGTLTVDGQPVTVAPTALDPAFDQATFDSTYVCTPDLKEVIPTN